MDAYPLPARGAVVRMTAEAASKPELAIAFQGAPGCNGHTAALRVDPDCRPLPCFSFEDTFDAVLTGAARRAVIPIENSLHGRVADVHHLLPASSLSIVGELFLPIQHCLLGVGNVEAIREVISHPQALGQCRRNLRAMGVQPIAHADTAAAAAHVASLKNPALAALAPLLAAELYNLPILHRQMSDADDNTTRFLVVSQEGQAAEGEGPWITTVVFAVRSIPAALYKALGGFATNGVNLTKLESYQSSGSFLATEFYCDIEGHPKSPSVSRALDELNFHSRWVRLLGTYARGRDRGGVNLAERPAPLV